MNKFFAISDRRLQSASSKWNGRMALAALLLGGLAFAPGARAATLTYSTAAPNCTDGAGTWGTTTPQWLTTCGSGSLVDWANGDSAIIGSGGTANSITLSGDPQIQNITFDPPSGYILKSSQVRITGTTGSHSIFQMASGVTANLANNGSSIIIADAAAPNYLEIQGPGTFQMDNESADPNTYSGGTILTSGTLQFSVNNDLGTGPITFNGGTLACLSSTALSLNNAVTISGGAILGQASVGTGALTFSGAVTLSGSSQTITVKNASDIISGAIGDGSLGYGITLAGPGILNLNNTETYTGPTVINTGTLQLGASGALNAASGVSIAAGATLDVSALATWSPGSTASPAITASGTASAATIKGGTTVALGASPVTLNWDGTHDTMLTISSGALTMSGGTITINGGSAMVSGTHNIIAVTGGSITESSMAVNGTTVTGSTVTVTTTGGSPNYLQINVQSGVPTVTTPTSSAIGPTTATLGATVTASTGGTITDYGVVWSTSPNPTTANNKISAGSTPTLGTPYTVNATGLPAGTTIYYAGYAINPAGTGYSASGTFTTLASPPTVQDTGATFSSVQGGSATVSWTRGNGSSCIVLVSSGAAVNANPVGGTAYTANTNFGTGTQIGAGNYVAYVGTGNSTTLLALSPSTTYYVAVYEFNGSGGSQNYLTTSPATASQTTAVHPVIYYSTSTATDPTATASWWTGNNGTGAQPANFTGGDTFIVQSGNNYTNAASWTVNATTAGTAATLQINSGGTLAMNNVSVTPFIYLGGNFVQNGTFTTFDVNDLATIDFTSSGTWTGSGNLNNNNATKLGLTVDATATLDASGVNSPGFTLDAHSDTVAMNINGTINLGANTVNGSNTGKAQFNLAGGATLITANTLGVPDIFTNFNTGKVYLTNTANYVFDGTSAQVTGTSTTNAAMPSAVNNLTINNSAGVTLSQSTTVNGTLTLTSGALTVGANTLALNGPAIAGTPANLTTTSASSLVFGGSSAGVSVPASVSALNNLTANNTSGVALSGAATVSGNTTISAGTLSLSGSGSIGGSTSIIVSGGATFDVSALSSTFALGAGQILSNSTSTATLNGSLNSGSGTFGLNFAAGTPALTVTSGTLTLSAGTTFTVNNTGAALGVGIYKLISKGAGGLVSGTVPSSVAVNGAGATAVASLSIGGNELYLVVGTATTTLLVSPENPSGFKDSISFTVNVQTNGVTAGNATGNVFFLTNSVLFDTESLSGGTATSVATTLLPRGANTITAEYAGDGNYFGSTNSLTQTVTNHPPVAGTASYTLNAGLSTLHIAISQLLANVTDADGDSISLVSVGVSTNGITLVNSSGYLSYQNTNNVNDQFSYTVTDGYGGTNTGLVNIVINNSPVFGQSATVSISGSTATVSFAGIPGYNYGVQRSTNLTDWVTILTTNAPSNGLFNCTDNFSDLGVVPASAYYRLQWNP